MTKSENVHVRQFQFTPLREGRPQYQAPEANYQYISIHAPA